MINFERYEDFKEYCNTVKKIMATIPIADHPSYIHLAGHDANYRRSIRMSDAKRRRLRVARLIDRYGIYDKDCYRVMMVYYTSRDIEVARAYIDKIDFSQPEIKSLPWTPYERYMYYGRADELLTGLTDDKLVEFMQEYAQRGKGMKVLYKAADLLASRSPKKLNEFIDKHPGLLSRYENYHVSDEFGRGLKYNSLDEVRSVLSLDQ